MAAAEIDALFAGKRRKAPPAPPPRPTALAAKRGGRGGPGADADGAPGCTSAAATAPRHPGAAAAPSAIRYTDDGLRIYTEEDIANDPTQPTGLNGACPFDCGCCF